LELLNEKDNENPDQALSVFDKSSKGTIMGDGGALLLLESLEIAEKRGAKIYCEVLGFESANHSYEPFIPIESGFETTYTLQKALVSAKIKPS